MKSELAVAAAVFFAYGSAHAQSKGGLQGIVRDPSGAVIPGATLTLSNDIHTLTAESNADGHYLLGNLPLGIYSLTVSKPGFARYVSRPLHIAATITVVDVAMAIAETRQEVVVNSDDQQVSIDPDQNASARVINGKELEALDDNPDALQSELLALAGPAAGPNGSQLYVDGFSGGQLPIKSMIKEIRINQNPLSAEFDRLGYGRVEVVTKPGAEKLSASVAGSYLNSALNTANPLASQQPNYQFYWLRGDLTGPIRKDWSYTANAFEFRKGNQSIVNAINPNDTSTSFSAIFATPSSLLNVNLRTDAMIGPRHILSVANSLYRTAAAGTGVGALVLPEQAEDSIDWENTLSAKDVFAINPRFVNETNVRWWRVHQAQTPASVTPSITVQGAFATGGNSQGNSNVHQDLVEIQNYSTAMLGKHTLRFGMRLRSYREASYSTQGANGAYVFQSTADYAQARPSLYTVSMIENPSVSTLLFDGALFLQDEWKVSPTLNASFGLRLEGQNHIHDPLDAAPRLAIAWSPSRTQGLHKMVFRAGYGWFYERFTVPNQIGGDSSLYLTDVKHNNAINQRNYVLANPGFYEPTRPTGPLLTDNGIPYRYSLAPVFHAALDMQATIGLDQQLNKHSTLSATYLYTRGLHQYLTSNATAPLFDPRSYSIVGPAPSEYNYQFQSTGIYKQHQLIVSSNSQFGRLSLQAVYTFNHANSDTQGARYFTSTPSNPNFDWGRATFGVTHQLTLEGSFIMVGKIGVSPFLTLQSGVPFNITLGSDLTGNNQFNARPTYGVCGAASVISTPYGCLDSQPTGKGEHVIPYNLGTGPMNAVLNLRFDRSIKIGNRTDSHGSRSTAVKIIAGATNLLNIVNLAPPNGVLNSPLFGRSQALASGAFASPSPGNRTVYFTGLFTF